MRKLFPFIACSLLLPMGWANALAQESPTVTPAQRLNLELVNNVSRYNIDTQENEYTNTFRLTQPNTDNKLTAGLLKQGDNYITVTRQGVKDGETVGEPTDFARINLHCESQVYPDEVLDGLNFQNLTSTGSLDNSIAQIDNWSSSGLYGNSGGYAYIQRGSNYYLRYTIPADFNIHNAYVIVYIYTTSSSSGYIKINGGNVLTASANTWNRYILSGMNAGDQITIKGCSSTGGNAASPYMRAVEIDWAVPLVPAIDVTPKYSTGSDGNWSSEIAGSVTTYAPNTEIAFDGMDNIVDIFTESTDDNTHPDNYSYSSSVNANVSFPTGGAADANFQASINFATATSEDPSTSTMTGHNGWQFGDAFTQAGTDNVMACWIQYWSSFVYTMPNDFAGNIVNVTVTSSNGDDGAGDLSVNGITHTFTKNSSYTWTNLPVRANGTIEFKGNGNYSVDMSRVEITSGNGNTLNAPSYTVQKQSAKMVSIDNSNKMSGRQQIPAEIKSHRINTNNSDKQ